MVVLGNAGGLWAQMSSFFFLGAALFGDILLIRICLVGGFLFLILNASTGLPDYKAVYRNTVDGEALIFPDMLVWFTITGFFHAYAIYRHLKDEAPVKLQDEDEEAVWRLFYRRSGMPRLEFKEVIKRAHWRKCYAGETIVDEKNALSSFHLIVEGVVQFHTTYHGVKSEPRTLCSGDLFDLRLANVFGVKVGFNSDSFTAVAKTDCVLLAWPFEQVNTMANRLAPSVSSYWRNMLLYCVASELNRVHPGVQQLGALDARNAPEQRRWREGGRSRDFAPLDPDEEPEHTTCGGILRWMVKSINPFPPPGIRHNSLPSSGILAKNRVEAVFQSLSQARKEPSALGRGAAASIVRHQQFLERQSRRATPAEAHQLEPLGEVLEDISGGEGSMDDNSTAFGWQQSQQSQGMANGINGRGSVQQEQQEQQGGRRPSSSFTPQQVSVDSKQDEP